MLYRNSFILISLILIAILIDSFRSEQAMVIPRANQQNHVQININSVTDIQPLLDQEEITEPEIIEPEPPEEIFEEEVIEMVEEAVEPIPEPTPVIQPTIQKPFVEAVKTPAPTPPKTFSSAVPSQPASSPDHKYIDDMNMQYKLALSAWLQKYKRYPLIAKKRHYEGLVKVKFSIDEQGRLLKYDITQGSRYKSLNEAVVKMLNRANPMPSIPTQLRNSIGVYEYEVPILFELKS